MEMKENDGRRKLMCELRRDTPLGVWFPPR